MTSVENGADRIWRVLRIVGWSVAGLILVAPAVAMEFTSEVNWTGGDFLFAAVLLGSVGGCMELALRKSGSNAYRIAVAIALALSFLLIWLTGAVGIIGSENEDANLLYGAVLAIALFGSIASLFRPRGMALAMAGAAIAQVLVPVTAQLLGWGSTEMIWAREVIVLTGLFAGLWLVAAALFRKAAVEG